MPERFDALAGSVLEFLAQRGATASAAAHAAAGAGGGTPAAAAAASWDVRGAETLHAAPRGAACVPPTATLGEVVQLLATGEHRCVFVSEEQGGGAAAAAGGGEQQPHAAPMPQGVVTATDILRVATGFAESDEEEGQEAEEDEQMDEDEDEGDEEEEDEALAGTAGGDDSGAPAELVAAAHPLAAEGRGADKGSAGALNRGG